MPIPNEPAIHITRQITFLEYLGDNLVLDNLDSNIKEEISAILAIDSSGSHYISYQPYSLFNSLTVLETNKTYIILSNKKYPQYVLSSITNQSPAPASLLINSRISLLTYKGNSNLNISASDFPSIEKIYGVGLYGNTFISWNKKTSNSFNSLTYLSPNNTYLIFTDGTPFTLWKKPPSLSGFNTANYNNGAIWNNLSGNITTVGSNGGQSYYGCYDMNGNVNEWVDNLINNFYKSYRGGSWASTVSELAKSFRVLASPSTAINTLGFRLASFSNPINHNFFVNIQDNDNFPDSSTGYGAVQYSYMMQKYQVTNDQYCDFLNSTSKTDTYGTYNSLMGSDGRGGINRLGNNGSYSYVSKACMGNKPVVFVNWYNAARYANWLHNGKPSSYGQNANSTEDGAYSLFGSVEGIIPKNHDADYWIPTEDEWVKAAYYKNPLYYSYATQTDSAPVTVGAGSCGSGPYCSYNSDKVCTITPTITPTTTPTPSVTGMV